MFIHTTAPWRAAALLGALLSAMPAVAQHTASPEVAARIHALRDVREPEERVQRWRASHA